MAITDAWAVRDTGYRVEELDDMEYWRWCALVHSWNEIPPLFVVVAAFVGAGKFADDKQGKKGDPRKRARKNDTPEPARVGDSSQDREGTFDDLMALFGAPVKVAPRPQKPPKPASGPIKSVN